MSFYMLLPSNVSPLYYPNNRISSFKVKLPKRFVFLPSEYQVALTEISFPHTMKSFIPKLDRTFELRHNDDPRLENEEMEYFTWPKLTLPDKDYSNISTLIEEFNNIVGLMKEPYNSCVTLEHDSVRDRVTIHIGEKAEALLSPLLSNYLGFRLDCPIRETKTAIFKPQPISTAHIFIYSDIVEQQVVGNTMVPLLRTVNVTGSVGETITQTFRPYYKQVSKLDFETVEILLCNEFGEELNFSSGTCLVTLHFKRKE